MGYQVSNPLFAEDIKQSFAGQSIMRLIGAELALVEPGLVEITIGYRKELTQQHGYLHAGVVTTIADSAAGYAAYSLMPARCSIGHKADRSYMMDRSYIVLIMKLVIASTLTGNPAALGAAISQAYHYQRTI